MNRLIAAAAAAIFCCTLGAKEIPETVTPASDSRITYVGRTLKDGNDVSFSWTGVYAKIRFEGTYLALRASDTKKNYYDIWVDRPADPGADRVIGISGKDSLYVLVDAGMDGISSGKGASSRVHEVIIKRRTEG